MILTTMIFLVAADVQGLYPNISRNLIKISLSNAIKVHKLYETDE